MKIATTPKPHTVFEGRPYGMGLGVEWSLHTGKGGSNAREARDQDPQQRQPHHRPEQEARHDGGGLPGAVGQGGRAAPRVPRRHEGCAVRRRLRGVGAVR